MIFKAALLILAVSILVYGAAVLWYIVNFKPLLDDLEEHLEKEQDGLEEKQD